MIKFTDVKEGSKYYDDIMEACNTFLIDGEPIMKGLPYQQFESGKPYVYSEIKADGKTLNFQINKAVKPTEDNPLYVMVDGVQWGYKSTKVSGSKTTVTLYLKPKKGAIVSIMSYGVPKVTNTLPVLKTVAYHPYYWLKQAEKYEFDPYGGGAERVTILGKALKRIEIDSADRKMSGDDLARAYIKDKTDSYIITPKGMLYVPWNYEGMSGSITYKYKGKVTTESFKAYTHGSKDTSHEPYRNDRFFPNAQVTRADTLVAVNRLRKHFLDRFMDSPAPTTLISDKILSYNGQRVFRLNGAYPAGQNLIKVYRHSKAGDPDSARVLLKKGKDYDETNNNTITMKKAVEENYYYEFRFDRTKTYRFTSDVGRTYKVYDIENKKLVTLKGGQGDWIHHVLELEAERVGDENLLQGNVIKYWYDKSETIPVVNKYLIPMNGGKSKNTKNMLIHEAKFNRYHVLVFLLRLKNYCVEKLT